MAAELREYSMGLGRYAEADALTNLHARIEKLREEASTARFRLDRSPASQHTDSSQAVAPKTDQREL
jgi:hypothetical protein